MSGASIYDDYAHHPTEIKATLEGARGLTDKKLWCVFQSHTYSRTKALLDEFSHSFDKADRVIIVDIYPARETDTLGMSPQVMATHIGGDAIACPKMEDAARLLMDGLEEGDVAIIMGAGNINRMFDILKNQIKKDT